jgi:Ca2+:H+ antiporter
MSLQRKSQSSNSTPNEDTNINTTSIPSPPSSPPVLNSPPPPPTLVKSIKIIFFSSWINVLLVFIPLGYIAYGLNWSNTSVFVLNFLAIVPLAKLLGFATEDISLRVGQVFIRII